VGSIPLVMKDELSAVGNHPETQFQNWMMTEALDEVFVFNRELSAADLAKLMTIRYGSAAAPVAGVPAVPPQVAATPAPRPPAATPAPQVAAATPPPAPKATPEPEAPLPPGALSAGEILKTYRKSLVFVSGADGNGSGFVAASGGTNFLFTNAHVAAGIKGAGFKSLEGAAVQVGAASIAVGHDIFRMQLPAAPGKPFEVMEGVSEKATIGDDVVVLGNAEGAGVINLIKGKIVGIGPDRVEVDAPFQPGNSGSPIIHLKTGQVIGVATYLTIRSMMLRPRKC
jgi:S1-C subfamily serine protease